jgi:hypothetical protein
MIRTFYSNRYIVVEACARFGCWPIVHKNLSGEDVGLSALAAGGQASIDE